MKRFKNILCVIETDEASKHVLERAITLAKNNQANLTVISIIKRITAGIGIPEGGPISADLQATMTKKQEQKLNELLEPYHKQVNVQVKVLNGTLFLQIIREVLNSEQDLVIKASQDYEWIDRWFSSDDMHLMRKCPCPVWLIKPKEAESYNRILTAIDLDVGYPVDERKIRHDFNIKLLEISSSLALSEFAELHIVHVWDAQGESEMRSGFIQSTEKEIATYVKQMHQQYKFGLDTLVDELEKKLGQEALKYLKIQTHLVKGWARKDISILAKEINTDLIVMGTIGRTGVPGLFMGNTAETILNQIDCSVLAIKPPGFVTPVTADD